MRLVFLGPPGAGKGTQAQRFAVEHGVPHVSTGDMLRATAGEPTDLGRHVKGIIESGRLVPDATMEDVVRERLARSDARDGFLLDGYPRTLPQGEFLDRVLGEAGASLDAVVFFDVPVPELQARLGRRGRADDTEEAVRTRLSVYFEDTRPLKEWYERKGLLRAIDGTGTPEDVYARLAQLAERLPR